MAPNKSGSRDQKGGDRIRKNQPLRSFGSIGDLEFNSMTFRGARLVWNSPGPAEFQPIFSLGESSQFFVE
ncbi:MAG: hypothetical protein LAO21_02070 [Acidobacteriia bacterium]|nr:hypothetical protein [Terriglobia bacterium]